MSAETTIDAVSCLEREPPRGKSDGHTVDTVVCACGVTAHSPSAATEGTLSGGPAGDDYVKSGNAGAVCGASWRMSWGATRRARTVLGSIARPRSRHTHCSLGCVAPQYAPSL